MADLAVAQQVFVMHTTQGLPVDVLLARDATTATFAGSNAILSGPRRANPWLELFEARLNFQSRFDESTKVGWFENMAPQPGEQTRYAVAYGVRGFCRVAYVPSLDGNGEVLLGAALVTSTAGGPEWIAHRVGAR